MNAPSHRPGQSKSLQGEMMLEEIDSYIVAEKCSLLIQKFRLLFKRILFDLQLL